MWIIVILIHLAYSCVARTARHSHNDRYVVFVKIQIGGKYHQNSYHHLSMHFKMSGEEHHTIKAEKRIASINRKGNKILSGAILVFLSGNSTFNKQEPYTL